MRIRLTLSLLVAAAAAALSPATALCGAWIPAPKDFSSEIRGGFYSSDDVHLSNGGRFTLPYGGLLEERSLTVTNELGWKKNLSVLIAVPLQSLTRRSQFGDLNETVTGFGDLVMGARWKIMGQRNALSLEVDWRAPLGYDGGVRLTRGQRAAFDTTILRLYTREDSAYVVRQLARPRLGDAQQDVQGLLNLGLAFPAWRSFFQCAAGYRYRFDAPVDQILLGGDLGLWVTNSLLLSGHYAGTIATEDGEVRADAPQEQLVGARLTARVDGKIDVFAGFMSTAGAENAPHRDQVYVGLAFKQSSLDRFQGFLGGAARP